MSRQSYSDETKAAVMAALLEGQSVSLVAKEYKIPQSTVSNWKAQSQFKDIIGDKKKERLGDLLLNYLQTNLNTLTAQSEVFADAVWLKSQTASELAVLHGVIADKTIRLLEAFSADEGEQDAAS
jgi:transposase-like protein